MTSAVMANVSFGKFLAKMASVLAKPDGLHVITPAEAPAFLGALSVEDFYGVGPATARRLHALGLRTGADLMAYGERALQSRLGRVGRHLHRMARGDDSRPVRPHRVRKSVGLERTFGRDLRGEEALVERLAVLADTLARRLARHEQAGRTLTLKIKDARFQITTRRTTTEAPVWEAADLLGLAVALLHRPAVPDARVRLLGLTASTLVPRDAVLGRQLAFAF